MVGDGYITGAGTDDLPDRWSVKVVGVTFVPGYPGNLHAIRDLLERRDVRGIAQPLEAVLKRNPTNKYDANAVEVHIPSLGDNGMIGHLPAKVAARLAPSLDAGESTWRATVLSVLITPGEMDKPGISIEVERIVAPAPVTAASLL